MIRILICDDQAIVTAGMSTILGSVADFQVVGAAGNGQEALQQAARLKPDLVLLDLKMPVMNGVEAARELRRQQPEIKILILSTYDQEEWVFDAGRAGAHGYLLKDTPPQDLIKAIRAVMDDKNPLDPAVAGRLMERVAAGAVSAPGRVEHDLNEREMEVLALLADGTANPEIAERLHLAPGTVRNIVSSILLKLGVEERTQAAVYALRNGLVKPRG